MLNHAQAARGRDGRRTLEVGEKVHVVVRCVEIWMVEHVERVELKTQAEAILDGELLSQAHIEAHLERPSENIAARVPVERLELVASGCVAGRHAVRARRNKLRGKIVGVEHGAARIDAEGALQLCLLRRYTGCERDDRVPDLIIGAKVQATHRTGKVVDAVWLAAFGYGLATENPAID